MQERVELGKGTGPLADIRVVEVAGVGPAPHACMVLADLGADVIRLERPSGGAALAGGPAMFLNRGRPSVVVDLKHPEAASVVLELVRKADVLIEGMRPGVMERLGLGPAQCAVVNSRLVYARMTGWGQDGPLAHAAGHDLTYIATAGVLHGLGQDSSKPHFPLNLLGDFGGGSTYLVIGVLAALLEARTSGQGQVIDAAILDGACHLNAMTYALAADGAYSERRGMNLLDGGAPFYDLYETADGRHVAVAALEAKFFDNLVAGLGLEGRSPDQADRSRWAEMREMFASTFRGRTQAEWMAIFESIDACVSGVLAPAEAAQHPHLVARATLVERDGALQPMPAPRFSRTKTTLSYPPPLPGQHTRAALTAWGVNDVDALITRGVVLEHSRD